MEIKFSAVYPQKTEDFGIKRALRYNIQETPYEEIVRLWEDGLNGDTNTPDASFIAEHKYMYNEVRIPQGQWNYGGIVNAIIRDKYRIDEMEAITNNMNVVVSQFFAELVSEGIIKATAHLVETMKEVSQDTFKEMQEWRALAKKEAKEIFKIQ